MKGIYLLALLLPLTSYPAQGKEIRWKQQSYSHYSDGESLQTVIQDLMSSENIPTIFSKKIKANENISIHLDQKPPEKVLDQLSKMYQFIWYFDGHALFVYDMSELTTATLKLKHISTETFTRIVKKIGLLDEQYQWELIEENGLIYFSGPKRMVTLIMELATVYDTKTSARISNSGNFVYRWTDKRGVVNFSANPPVDKAMAYKVISQDTGEIVRETE